MSGLSHDLRLQNGRFGGQILFFTRLAAYLSLGSIAGAFAITLIAVISSRWIPQGIHPDLFLSYDVLRPGAPQEVLAAFDCNSTETRINGQIVDTPIRTCSLFPRADSLYHLITIQLENDLVREITFFSGDLLFSDLLQRWGDPQTITRGDNGHSFTMQWDAGNYIAIAVISEPRNSSIVRLLELKQK